MSGLKTQYCDGFEWTAVLRAWEFRCSSTMAEEIDGDLVKHACIQFHIHNGDHSCGRHSWPKSKPRRYRRNPQRARTA